ncbi:aldose 1-epimerase family protein [Falsiroseomonas ponticola]|uniref:aldose 1-epimerase family protein n=1 Tax=Falsiroseomonas ponticola TaxID=2786951 RepID=UPI001932414C|nr:aldose 1-epimerase family protein [Roseomonas ponticola]
MPFLFGRRMSRGELLRQVGRLEQVAGITLSEFADGPERPGRHLDIRSGGGLELRVLVDRGFDIGALTSGGVPLGWRSPNGFRSPFLHHDDEDGGAGMLRSLDGFMVTCGLDHVRGPAEGSAAHFGPRRPTQHYPLHGRIAQTPAKLLGQGEVWEGDDCTLWCEAELRQTMLYGEVFALRRRIAVPLGSTSILIEDRIQNLGFRPTPFVQLYHLNFGFPLLDRETEVYLPDAAGLASVLRGPTAAPEEAGDELYEAPPAPGGTRRAGILNRSLAGGIGVALDWDAASLPHLQIWRNMAQGMQVLAIEPATNEAAKRAVLEAAGAIRYLAPGETVEHRLRIEVLHGAAALARFDAPVP